MPLPDRHRPTALLQTCGQGYARVHGKCSIKEPSVHPYVLKTAHSRNLNLSALYAHLYHLCNLATRPSRRHKLREGICSSACQRWAVGVHRSVSEKSKSKYDFVLPRSRLHNYFDFFHSLRPSLFLSLGPGGPSSSCERISDVIQDQLLKQRFDQGHTRSTALQHHQGL
ncbi:hypothetical protein INR49_013581 [Caranx melampygus]|nr:hypothetical protein INR49_013581 [Caranx melampygus]